MTRKFFIAIVRLDRWLRVRFTPVGLLLLCALVAVGLFALNPRATLAYQLALLIFAVLFSAMLWTAAFRPRYSARRKLPMFATVGVPLEYTLEIENHQQGQLFGLEAVDEPPRVTSKQTMHRARAQRNGVQTEGRWWMPRVVGYMNFVLTLRSLEGVQCEAAAIAQLAPQTITRVLMRFTPTRRGYLRLSKLRLMRSDPLGVFRAVARVVVEDQLLVLPKRYRKSWNSAGSSTRNAQQGLSRSRVSGSGTDFARLREYRPRDPMHHIHWRAWARLGAPVVKVFHEESPSRNALVLDVCVPAKVMSNTFEEAVCVAASFVTESGWCSGQLDLLAVGKQMVRTARDSEGAATARMLEALACVREVRDGDFATFTQDLSRRLDRFSSCVLVLLDLDPPRLKLVRELQQAQISTLVLLVSTQPPEHAIAVARSLPDPEQVRVMHPQNIARAFATLAAASGSRG